MKKQIQDLNTINTSKLCQDIEKLNWEVKENVIIYMIENRFLNLIKVNFEDINCIVTIKTSNEKLEQRVGNPYYGLIPYIVGEMQVHNLEFLLDKVLLKLKE
jgi:hypothetical protein